MSPLSTSDRKLIAAIQGGLPLVSRPYELIGRRIGMSESNVLARITELQNNGSIKRSGIIVRHHELGFRANAMVTWNVPNDKVTALGRRIAKFEWVTLCYRRARFLPEWPYNLYCMIHGRDRQSVIEKVKHITKVCGLVDSPPQMLFSGRRFKQCGARYVNNKTAVPSVPLQRVAGQAG